jgi:hypothetical protein
MQSLHDLTPTQRRQEDCVVSEALTLRDCSSSQHADEWNETSSRGSSSLIIDCDIPVKLHKRVFQYIYGAISERLGLLDDNILLNECDKVIHNWKSLIDNRGKVSLNLSFRAL